MPQQQDQLPPIPAETQQEGGRWRFHRPSSAEVAAWFETQPLDEGMEHAHYVGGIVLIPQTEKVKYQQQRGTVERYEQVFAPYMQIGTRIAYFRRLAEKRALIPRIVAAEVPRIDRPESPYYNGNLPPGFWWFVVRDDQEVRRFLCCTIRAALYEPGALQERNPEPVLEGISTKQGSGGADPNSLMKSQTSAIGRALGVAGILVVGTGVASAEDMAEPGATAGGAPGGVAAALPPVAEASAPPLDAAEELTQLRGQALALQDQMKTQAPAAWQEFAAWWNERRAKEGWETLNDVPLDAMRGVISKMERDLAAPSVSRPDASTDSPPNDRTAVSS